MKKTKREDGAQLTIHQAAITDAITEFTTMTEAQKAAALIYTMGMLGRNLSSVFISTDEAREPA